MTRLPRVTADQVLAKLLRAGFTVVRTSGAHMRIRHPDGRATTIPRHSRKTLKPKTLQTILSQAGLNAECFLLL